MEPRILALGDVHGRYEALKEVLTLSKFDYNNDTLIVLGDIGDGGFNTSLVLDELIKVKNIVFVIGNHDCVTENTEVLTTTGWQKINCWNGEDVAQYDLDNQHISFAKPLNYIKNKKRDCVRIEGINTCQEVSLNHYRYNSNGVYIIIRRANTL